ncbi:uncharacterized protein LTR77_003327 [Saxophila tyrrhenica]|uniref:WW domain-containing protein n=1 Tax=Saxophila tyrrhenica TaxID=1690608 RepID=A0AAV9PLP8_9PEZI|nr:hypothetical protein LTR77_003327 [Saxophila tyrrhenica]
MPDPNIPSEPPPSYDQVAGGSSSSRPAASSSLQVPGQNEGGMPSSHRRSMEDELRPLPKGWVRQYDSEQHHQFFVDTNKEPPRSTWVHPYDDEEYLSTLPGPERERVEQESLHRGHPPSKEDVIASHTDDEEDHHGELPPRGEGKGKEKESKFGRKLKDKLTGTTHEQREQSRQQRAEYEQKLYERHLQLRHAMAEAARTGQPQLMGKDRDGKDIYIEPPRYRGGYGGGGYGYSPYGGMGGGGGIYDTPNARYIRPANPYGRPMGRGYGGGYGLPLAMGGGLMGGMMLGGMMGGGGFGGGDGGGGGGE